MMARYPYTRNDALWEQSAYDSLFWNPQNMNQMERRLRTFNYWPSSAASIKYDLAKDGLYYTGEGDIVQCFCCDIQLCRWKKRDSPNVRHRKESPQCPMANPELGSTVNVEFFPSLGETVCPQVSLITASSSSSGSSSGPSSGETDADKYLEGLETDGAAPRTSEKQNRPKSKAKSKRTVHNDQMRKEYQVVPKHSTKVHRDLDKTDNANQRDTNNRTDSEGQVVAAINQIRASGVNNDHLKLALERLLAGKMQITIESLMNMISEVESDEKLPNTNGNRQKHRCDNEVNIREQQRLTSEQKMLDLEYLIEREKCRICRKERAMTLYLPCAHMVACEGCTKSISRCPSCDKVIRGTKQVFFA